MLWGLAALDIVERLRLLVGQFAQDACGVFVCISPLDAAHMSGAHGWPASPTPKKNCYFSSAPDQGDHPGTGDGTNARPERERVPPFGAIRDEAQKQIVIYLSLIHI